VLETGDYDFAINLQVESVLENMQKTGGEGVVETIPGAAVEAIYCNFTDPNKEVDGQRSPVGTPHPFLTDVGVRRALALAVDKQTIAKQLYREEGTAAPNVLTTQTKYASKNTRLVLSIGAAGRCEGQLEKRDNLVAVAKASDAAQLKHWVQKRQWLKERGVKYCLASLVDIHGTPKAKAVPIEHFDRMMAGSDI
jgi:ABC-type transport system substrate-binding protein